MRTLGKTTVGSFFLWWTLTLQQLRRGNSHGYMSRHLVIQNLSTVVVLADAFASPGPFEGDENDYIQDESDYSQSLDLLAAAVAVNRTTVLEGIPISLNVNILDISDGQVGRPLKGVEVFLYHCDAVGIYSAVDSPQQSENTEGQKWLRGRQTTNENGTVTYHTILPGWYRGRLLHYHVRMKLPGEATYIASSQLFISDADRELYQCRYPYSEATTFPTPQQDDHKYESIPPQALELLTLKLKGSVSDGFTSTVNLGLTGMEDVLKYADCEDEQIHCPQDEHSHSDAEPTVDNAIKLADSVRAETWKRLFCDEAYGSDNLPSSAITMANAWWYCTFILLSLLTTPMS